jgi:hypothetical protein
LIVVERLVLCDIISNNVITSTIIVVVSDTMIVTLQ